MADSAVAITAGLGTNIDTRTNAAGDHRQVVALGTDGDNLAHVEAWGQVHVTQGPATLFFDDFSSTLNTTDLWSVTGNAPAVSGGRLVPSATVSSYNFQRSIDLLPNGVGFVDVRMGVQLEATAATGCGRFWGLGLVQGSPTATSLILHGAGFEIDQATGALLAVTYNNGARTTVATLTRPTDGNLHRYSIVHRVTRSYWFLDGYQVAAATVEFADVVNADLPVAIVRQNAASFTGTPVFSITGVFAADTNRDATMIADSLVPARRARVSATGGLSVALTRDIGRTQFSATLTTTAPTTADTLATITPVRAGVAGTPATSLTVTAGKVLRITNVVISVRTTTAANPWVKVVLRMNPSGAAVIGSTQVVSFGAGGTAAVIGNTGNVTLAIEDALEFSGTQQFGLSVSGNVNTNVLDVTLLGYEV